MKGSVLQMAEHEPLTEGEVVACKIGALRASALGLPVAISGHNRNYVVNPDGGVEVKEKGEVL